MYIFTGSGLAYCRCRPLSSKVRPKKHGHAFCQLPVSSDRLQALLWLWLAAAANACTVMGHELIYSAWKYIHIRVRHLRE